MSTLVPPTQHFTTSDQVRLEYADEGPGDPMLLVMGINLHLIHWPPSLCENLRTSGLRTIRFDNRDCGGSSKMDHLGVPSRFDLFWGRNAPYRLDAMATDGFALLDHLGLHQVHLCGISMGGMIAQLMALRHPERFKSLSLLMTTPGGFYLPSWSGVQVFLNRPATSREGVAHRFLANQRRLAGPGAPPLGHDDETLELGRLLYDRSGGVPKPEWFMRQFAAVRSAPARAPKLRGLRVPTRIIHGAIDPLVPVRAAFDLARHIPDADLHVVPRLGHVLPFWARPQLATLISGHARRYP